MAQIGPRSSAQDVKDATGYQLASQWRYFQNLTRDFLLHIFNDPDAGNTGDQDFTHQCQELAEELMSQQNGMISTWDKVKPRETAKALDIINAQLRRQGMDEISAEVLRWRMLQAFRYEKKRSDDKKRKDAASGSSNAEAQTPLPSISSLLDGPLKD